MDIRKISIIGSGTLGIMYGRFLSKHLPAGNVRFIADENLIETYRNTSIICNGSPCRFTFVPFGADDPADLVIFAMRFGEKYGDSLPDQRHNQPGYAQPCLRQ